VGQLAGEELGRPRAVALGSKPRHASPHGSSMHIYYSCTWLKRRRPIIYAAGRKRASRLLTIVFLRGPGSLLFRGENVFFFSSAVICHTILNLHRAGDKRLSDVRVTGFEGRGDPTGTAFGGEDARGYVLPKHLPSPPNPSGTCPHKLLNPL
ncbi:hypothetical protein Vretifemale_3961, partial [Volvox reticuliferus]